MTEYWILYYPKIRSYMISSTVRVLKHTIRSFWYSILQNRSKSVNSSFIGWKQLLVTVPKGPISLSKVYNRIPSPVSSIHFTFYNQWTSNEWWHLLFTLSSTSLFMQFDAGPPLRRGPGHYMWDFWWTRSYWNRFSSVRMIQPMLHHVHSFIHRPATRNKLSNGRRRLMTRFNKYHSPTSLNDTISRMFNQNCAFISCYPCHLTLLHLVTLM